MTDDGPPGVDETEDLQELFRQEAEGITDRLDVLVGAGTEEGVVEALRLAHTLKGLAVSTESHALRDLARSLEAALVGYSGDDAVRRGQLLSAIDAARGLVIDNPEAPSAARRAAAALREVTRGDRPRGTPVARRALLRRLLKRADDLVAQLEEGLQALQVGVDDHRVRLALGRQWELWGAAVGLVGQPTLSLLALELAAFLFERSPPVAALSAAQRVLQELTIQRRVDAVDRPLERAVVPAVEALRANSTRRPDEERLSVPLELPWPDVDLAGDLLATLDRLSAGQAILDARPGHSGSRFLRGTLGLAPLRRRGREEQGFVKVPRRRLDRLARRAEELISAKTRAKRLASLARKLAEQAPPGARLGLHRLARLASEHDRELDHLARGTQEAVLRARLVTVRGLFALARMTIREYLSRHPAVAVEVIADGAATELDKATLDALVEPVLHLVKNALIHGIEPRAERATLGKPEIATLRLTARAGLAGVTIEVADDGRGMDPTLLVDRPGSDGLLVLSGEGHDERALVAGVSTAQAVTDDAGRGVGLASVLERVRSLRGRLLFRSTPGQGTLARLMVPPAVATARVLLVRAGAEHYALPLASVRAVEEVRGEGGPGWVRLSELVGQPGTLERRRASAPPERERRMRDRFAVRLAPLVTRGERVEHELRLVVDDVLRRDLVVVRPFGQRFAHPGVDGAALFGDGRLLLVIDAWRLYQQRGRASAGGA